MTGMVISFINSSKLGVSYAKGQLDLLHRSQVCNESLATMDLMIIVGNDLYSSFQTFSFYASEQQLTSYCSF